MHNQYVILSPIKRGDITRRDGTLVLDADDADTHALLRAGCIQLELEDVAPAVDEPADASPDESAPLTEERVHTIVGSALEDIREIIAAAAALQLSEEKVRALVEDHFIAKLPDLEQLMQNMVREALEAALNTPTNTNTPPSEDGAVIGEASPAPAGEVLTPDASPTEGRADESATPTEGATTSKRKRS